MTFDASDIHDNVVSVPQQLGIFDQVLGHEPLSAPTGRITCAVWLDVVGPVPAMSGLDSTTGLVVFTARVYIPALSEPLDDIEKNMLKAMSALLTGYSGDFELDSSVRNVDLMGATGRALAGKTGYLTMDGTIFRVADVVIPLIINDVWAQVA
jgi:hypothetical protein